MAKLNHKNGITSVILRVKILSTAVTTGAGLTGLTSASSGLIISTIADNEATPTAYTVAATNVETITTLGTFAAPTASKCRFREVDATNHPGVYEIQIANARWAVSSARSVIVSVSGATNAAQVDAEIQLDPVPSNVTQLSDDTQSLMDLKDFADAGYDPGANKVQGVVLVDTTTTLANLPAITANWLTAAGIAADAGAEIAALVETYIVNEGDATAVMQAIADKIAADWVAGDASPLAVASAVWANATRTLSAFSFTPTPSNAADTTAILADTNELQTDWVNGGRLDLILDIVAADTTTDIPALIAAEAVKTAAIKDRVSYCLTVLVGASSDAGTAAETYAFAIGGETFTADYMGLDATGNRTTTTLSKV